VAKSLDRGVSRLGFAESLLDGDVRKQCDQLHLDGEQWRLCCKAVVVFHRRELGNAGTKYRSPQCVAHSMERGNPERFPEMCFVSMEYFCFEKFCYVSSARAFVWNNSVRPSAVA